VDPYNAKLVGVYRYHYFFFIIEGPRSRCYGRTAALRLIVQPYDENDEFFLLCRFNGAQVE
jgi:hypothetical protein